MKRASARRAGVSRQKTTPDATTSVTAADVKAEAVKVSWAGLEERVADVRDSWETDSLFEDVLDGLSNEESTMGTTTGDDEDMCTPEEAIRLRRQLREQGPAVFCQRTVDCGRYTAKRLLTAFTLKPPAFLEGEPDDAYFNLLSLAISRELSKRIKLGAYNTVDDAVRLIARSSNIIVITGAGISTSLGIPDFRSKGTGLYSKLEHLGLGDPQEVFDIDVFRQDPAIFYSVARDIIPATDRYTPTHEFIAMLHQRGKLLTNYSQNIDNLEVKAGLPRSKLIQCHGSFGTATCVRCHYRVDGEAIVPDIRAGNIPRCPRCCTQTSSSSAARKRKRSAADNGSKRRRRQQRWSAAYNDTDDTSDEDDYNSSSRFGAPQPPGVMKPDITFFGEALPDEFSRRLTEHDRDRVDLVIVMGTSLKVTPVSEIVSWLPGHVPQIYISRQAVDHINFDIDLLGECDTVVAELCRRLGWPLVHEMLREEDCRGGVRVRAEAGCGSRHLFERADTTAGE